MKFTSVIPAIAGLSALVAAVPLRERDLVMLTKTQVVRTTVEVVKTVWAEPNSAPATNAPKVQPQAMPTPASPQPTKIPKLSHHPAPVAPQPSPSSVVVPQAPPAPANPQPAPVQPKPVHHAHPKPVQPKPQHQAPPSSPPSSGGSNSILSGQGTYYTPGLGSCGWTSTDSDYIVALATDKMQNPANPNSNPMCGKTITITYKGVSQTAKVVDTCVACALDDVDMSPSLFQQFSPLAVGRIDIQWHFN